MIVVAITVLPITITAAIAVIVAKKTYETLMLEARDLRASSFIFSVFSSTLSIA